MPGMPDLILKAPVLDRLEKLFATMARDTPAFTPRPYTPADAEISREAPISMVQRGLIALIADKLGVDVSNVQKMGEAMDALNSASPSGAAG